MVRDGSDLAQQLRVLRVRSGRSYTALERSTGLSRSSLHRYCQGTGVPSRFGVIEQIALACGADAGELAQLHRSWVAITAPEQATETPAPEQATEIPAPEQATETPAPIGETAAPGPPTETADPNTRRPPRLRWAPARMIACVVVAALAALILAASGGPPPAASTAEPAQTLLGPDWVQPPTPVRPEFFGVTINSSTGAMPGFQVGAVRLWDSGTRWSLVEPSRGHYDWAALDRLVAGARRRGLPVLYTFGGTPRWASQQGAPAPYPEGARSSAPDDPADWDAFVRAVVTRYRGQIGAYELWNFAPSPHFFSSGPARLADLARRASAIVKTVDPAAVVACPGMGGLWEPAAQRFLIDFAAAGGYQNCDVAAVKLYQRKAGDRPESMAQLGLLIDAAFHRAGVALPVWNTGTSYTVATDAPLSQPDAENAAVRFFLIGLYLRYERLYFYNWGGRKLPIVLQPEAGAPTRAALFVEQLQRWLFRARITDCGRGTGDGLPPGAWQCRFVLADGRGAAHSAAIRWMEAGTATMTAEQGAVQVRRLDGSRSPVRAGMSLPLTGQPILVEFGGT